MRVKSLEINSLETRHSKDSILSLLETEGYGWWRWHVATGALTWSSGIRKMFVIDAFDHRIESFQQRVHPDDRPAALAGIATAVKQRRTFSAHMRVLGDDGVHRPFFNAARVVVDRKGRMTAMVGYVRPCHPGEFLGVATPDLSDDRSLGDDHADIARIHQLLAAAEQTSDPEALAAAEIGYMEFVLSPLVSRAEARLLSRRLLDRFQSFSRAVTAEASELLAVEGMRPAYLPLLRISKLSAAVLLRPRREPVSFDNIHKLVFYLRSVQAYRAREQFRVVFLNAIHHIIHDEVMSEGTLDFTPVFVRDVIKRALELDAQHLILVHNHPSGDPSPSLSDIEMTYRVRGAARAVGLDVIDHIVLGQYGHVSFRALGLIEAAEPAAA